MDGHVDQPLLPCPFDQRVSRQRARSWRASAEPLHLAAFRAELTHPGQVTYDCIDQLRIRKDLNRYLASHVETPLS